MRYLSVCSGIEAASVAWEPLGWTAAGYSEIEPFPRAVLQHRLGAVPCDWDHRWQPGQNYAPLFGDFTQIEEHHVGPIDLLVGGTPCQSFSVAGKRLGLDDPRGHLTLEFLALARRLRPRWLLWENVPGVLSDDGGATLGTFLGIVGQLGYRGCYRVLDAQFVRVAGGHDRFSRAVPQRRRRVFFVGHLGDDARAFPVLFEPESLRGHPAPRRQAGQGAAPTLSARVNGGGGLGTDFDCDGGLIAAEVAPTLNSHFGDKQGLENQHIDGGGACSLPPVSLCLTARTQMRSEAETETLIPITGAVFDVAHTLLAKGNDSHAANLDTYVAHCLSADGFDASEDGTGRGTPLVPVCFDETQITSAANYSNPAPGDPCHPLAAGARPPTIAFSSKDYGNDAMDDLSPTLRSMGHDASHANGGGQVAIAIQERAVCENPDAGPQGAGFREDGAAYTLEARHHVQAVAYGLSTQQKPNWVEDLSPSLALPSKSGGGQVTAVAFDMRGREGGAQFEGPHDTANVRAASGGSSKSYVAETWAVRRLTPRECERLQGFPDDWTLIPWRKGHAADGPRYKAIGNSMAVNVMSWIGLRIDWADKAAGCGA